MATKAEIKAELDKLGVKYKARASLDTLEQLLADAVVADLPEVEEVPVETVTVTETTDSYSPPAEPDTTNIESGEIIAISFGERFVDGEYKGRTCTVLRSGGMNTDQIFTAQSYGDVLISLQSWLKEEGKRWR